MAASCSFFFWRDKESGKKVEQHFLARTSQFGLRLAVREKSGDHLVLQTRLARRVRRPRSTRRLRLSRTCSRLGLAAPPPGSDGVPVIRWLLDAVQQHELDDVDARRARKEEEVLREWASTLRFRQQLDEGRHSPIPYDGFRVDGNRVSFSISSLPNGVVLDQPRMIRRDQRIVLSGVVDDVAADRLVLWIERGVSDFPPERGQIVIDDRASRVAIDRQKGALDAVRYGRCLQPSLRTLILDPRQSRPPSALDVRRSELDPPGIRR